MRAASFMVLLVSAAGLVPTSARAQSDVDALFPSSDDATDPLGTGDTASLSAVPSAPPRPVVYRVERGDVLAAIPGVREVDHELEVHLVDGLATVTVRQRFVHRGQQPAEVDYRMPVPSDAILAGVEVLLDGAPADADANASALIHDGQVAIRASPIERGVTTTVVLTYTTEARVRGGVSRVVLPARGHDPRIAPARVAATADGLLAPILQNEPLDRPVIVESWRDVTITGRLPTGGAPRLSVERFACGDERCARVHVEAGTARARAENYVLLIDASPSTNGPMRGRMGPVIAALADIAHVDSTLRAVAFGARAEVMDSEPLPVSAWVARQHVAHAQSLELGPSTRVDAALAASAPSRPDHVIVLGDGAVARGQRTERALAELRAAGVRVSVINVGDNTTQAALSALASDTGGVNLELGDAADARADDERLRERMTRLTMPVAARRIVGTELGELRAGDGATWMGVVPRRTLFAAGATRTPLPRRVEDETRAALLASRFAASARMDFGVSPRDDVQRVDDVEIVAAPAEVVGSLSSRAALTMLRSRLIPAARRCLRADRRGRANYSVRATYEFVLFDREVDSAIVRGEIDERLRECLEETVNELEVPPFQTRVRVRYPIRTEAVVGAPAVEIVEDVDDVLEAVVGDEPTRPRAR